MEPSSSTHHLLISSPRHFSRKSIARSKAAEHLVDSYKQENGAFISIGCNAAPVSSIRSMGLSRRSTTIILRVRRWTAQFWVFKLQLHRSQHEEGPPRLLQSEARTRIFPYSKSCCRLVTEFPHRPEVQLAAALRVLVVMLIKFSPQLPTPRRSLFSSNLFGTLNGRGKSIMLNRKSYS